MVRRIPLTSALPGLFGAQMILRCSLLFFARTPLVRPLGQSGKSRAGICASLLLLLSFAALAARADCFVCGGIHPGNVVYTAEDRVTHHKEIICEYCEENFADCFLCGMPADPNKAGFLRLADERVVCARDALTVVVREDEGVHIFNDVRDSLDRMLTRFTSFPSTNITLEMVDRIHLQELFTLAGNDYHCPNILGYTQTSTNHGVVEHHISLMTALPRSWLQSVCAHELTHAWVAENVSRAGRTALARETEEGFCELIAFLSAASRSDEAEKASILHNAYTRGQVDLFVAAESTYGFNDVLDWMRYGTDSRLLSSDPGRVHKIKLPEAKPVSAARPFAFPAAVGPAPAPATNLLLKAVFWNEKAPLALINDHTFSLDEEGKVRLGETNVTVHCIRITPTSVRIRVGGRSDEEELLLKNK